MAQAEEALEQAKADKEDAENSIVECEDAIGEATQGVEEAEADLEGSHTGCCRSRRDRRNHVPEDKDKTEAAGG